MKKETVLATIISRIVIWVLCAVSSVIISHLTRFSQPTSFVVSYFIFHMLLVVAYTVLAMMIYPRETLKAFICNGLVLVFLTILVLISWLCSKVLTADTCTIFEGLSLIYCFTSVILLKFDKKNQP